MIDLSEKGIVERAASWMQIVKSLPFDGGPSATRWVFIRTSEIVSLGWLALVAGAVYEFVRYAHVDITYCGLITVLGSGLFAFAQQAQIAKLGMDSKNSGPAATVETTLGSTKVSPTEPSV